MLPAIHSCPDCGELVPASGPCPDCTEARDAEERPTRPLFVRFAVPKAERAKDAGTA